MKYDFDSIIERRGTDAVKWSVSEGELPMWVADMDFQAAPEILSALRKRLDHGVMGYCTLPDAWRGAYAGWWQRRHGFALDKNWLLFCTGAVPAIASIVRKLTVPGENVVLQTPVYNAFFSSVACAGRQALESPLKYQNGAYAMDFEDLEQKLRDPQTTLMILCNPQNPTGNIWAREDLARVGALCRQYAVTVIADEIHCDITAPGRDYIPFASVSPECRDISITCVSPTKCFNIAGLQTSAVFVPDPLLRGRVERALRDSQIAEPGVFASPAAVAAFDQGEAWLDEMRHYVFENRRVAAEYMARHIPGMGVVPGEATYLMWLDVRSVCPDSRQLAAFIRRETGLFLTAGVIYGAAGEGFFRLNIACPRTVLLDGLDRLSRGIALFRERAGAAGV